MVSGAAAAGYLVMDLRVPPATAFRSRRGLAGPVAGIALWGSVVVFVVAPWAPAVLAVLVWTAWAGLSRLDARADQVPTATAPPRFRGPAGLRWTALAPLAAVPVVAVATYAALAPLARDSGDQTGSGPFQLGFVAAVAGLGLAGTVALAWSLWRAWRPAHRTPAASVAPGSRRVDNLRVECSPDDGGAGPEAGGEARAR